jgi:APA family basic amino acid/polyamine antiporter
MGSISFQWIQILLMILGLVVLAKPLYRLFTWKSANLPSGFRCPAVPLVPVIAIAANIYMMVNLSLDAWLRLWIWLGGGLVIYVFYGRIHSKLNK